MKKKATLKTPDLLTFSVANGAEAAAAAAVFGFPAMTEAVTASALCRTENGGCRREGRSTEAEAGGE